MNLLIPCYSGADGPGAVTPLSAVIEKNREWLGDTSIVAAGSAMEMLIAGADRIMVMKNHCAQAISRESYRQGLSAFYQAMYDELNAGVKGGA